MAITYAASHPDRTRALVLFNGAVSILNTDLAFGMTKEVADFVVDYRATTWGTEDAARP
jgi:pimeloyl-ACP methyl ester carboxylesterase